MHYWISIISLMTIMMGCTPTEFKAMKSRLEVSEELSKFDSGAQVKINQPSNLSEWKNEVRVSGFCAMGDDVNVKFASLQSDSPCVDGEFSAQISLNGDDGVIEIVAAQNINGEIGQDQVSVVKDTVAPIINIISPQNGDTFNQSTEVSGSCEVGLSVSIQGDVAAPGKVECTGGSFSFSATMKNGEGVNVISVNQTDQAGNISSMEVSITNSVQAPNIEILQPKNGEVLTKDLIEISGVCEDGLPISVLGKGVLSPSTASCEGGSFAFDITLANGDGDKEVIVSQVNSAKVTSSSTKTYIRMPSPLDGASLYANSCAGCHGALQNSEKKNRSANQIQAAFKNIPQMRNIKLTPEEIQAIADVL